MAPCKTPLGSPAAANPAAELSLARAKVCLAWEQCWVSPISTVGSKMQLISSKLRGCAFTVSKGLWLRLVKFTFQEFYFVKTFTGLSQNMVQPQKKITNKKASAVLGVAQGRPHPGTEHANHPSLYIITCTLLLQTKPPANSSPQLKAEWGSPMHS